VQYLDEKLKAYAKGDVYPFHMPGHKRKELPFPNPYRIDITEIDGFDNLHHAEEILKEAQERAAALYGAKQSFYLVNGSTCGLLAAISAAAAKGSRVLVARNCHKAVYHALYLRELDPEYLYPVVAFCGIQGQILPEQVKEALDAQPDFAAVILTSPTYEGVVSDIRSIADIVHEKGIPLIVDAAHGAHFGFGGGFPESPVAQGADAVIMSLHKTLPSFTQTAVLHLCSDRIPAERIAQFLGIYETSSPSYLFMAGMDACVRMLAEDKKRLFSEYRKRLDDFYDNVKNLTNLHVLTRADLSQQEAWDWDDSKLVIFTTGTGMTGEELHQKLLHDYRLQMEMISGEYVLGMTSIMDTPEGFARLAQALCEIDHDLCKTDVKDYDIMMKDIIHSYSPNPRRLCLAEAMERPWRKVPLAKAPGHVMADFIYLYPPGIPLVVPGEVVTAELVEQLFGCIEAKLALQGGGWITEDCIFLKTILY
jgi:arginine/lysine/ornithine decarboxylase